MILVAAWWIARRRRYIHRFKQGLIPELGMIGMLIVEPDLGTTVLFGTIGMGMLLLGGAHLLHILGPAGAVTLFSG